MQTSLKIEPIFNYINSEIQNRFNSIKSPLQILVRQSAPLGYSGLLKATSEIIPLKQPNIGLAVLSGVEYSIPQIMFRHKHIEISKIGKIGFQHYAMATVATRRNLSLRELYWKGFRLYRGPQYLYNYIEVAIVKFGLPNMIRIIKGD